MLETGIKGKLELTVSDAMTAANVGSGELSVYATPMLAALVEETAWRSVAKELDAGQGTVGTKLNIAHLSATPVGMKVWCETELVEIDRRRLVFTAQAFDESGRIAECTHERFIVDNERFMSKANAKLNKQF